MNILKLLAHTFTHPDLGLEYIDPNIPSQEGTLKSSLIKGDDSPKRFFGRIRGMLVKGLALILLLIVPTLLSAQDFTQTINRTAQFENPGNAENELRVYNINGSVTVEGYDGDAIQIAAIKEIDGTSREVEQAKEELSLRVEQEADLVLIYLDAPFITLTRKDDRISYRMDRWDNDYQFLLDITIRVPRNTHIYAATINRGMVTVENTTRNVSASNVNGELQLSNISGPTKARTVNGDITAIYSGSPDEDSEYHTINGTIEVSYPEDLSADIRFESMHGDLYTDFQNIERLQAQVKKDTRSKGGKTTYRLDRFTPIRIGKGGPNFSFEVLNGDVFIKRIKS